MSLKKSKLSSLPFLEAEIRKLQYGTAATFGCLFLAKLNETPCLTDFQFQHSHIAKLFYSLMRNLICIVFKKSKKNSLSFLKTEIWKL